MSRILLFGVALVLMAASCTKEGSSTSVIQDKQVYTVQDQIIIGNQFSAAMKADPENFDILNANAYPEITTYLNTMLNSAVISEHVLNRPSAGTQEGGFDWEIITLIDEDAYAYSMPGGKVVVSSGILKALSSESELLALLSNEMYFTDIDMHTEALKDEYSGIRIGNIALGNSDADVVELITFLRDQSFTEEQMLAADRRTIAVMCPFNYDVESLMSIIERSHGSQAMDRWQTQRPRPENWNELLNSEIELCSNNSNEQFRSRYLEMTSTLP